MSKDKPTRGGVGILLMDEFNRGIWIAQRTKKGNYWEHWYQVPGGKVDPGETDMAAALRELNEETGLNPDDLFDTPKLLMQRSYKREGHDPIVITHYVAATAKLPDQTEPDKNDPWELITWSDLWEYKLMPPAVDALVLLMGKILDTATWEVDNRKLFAGIL